MGYSKRTQHYNIPVMGRGDVMTEQWEMKQMQQIDDMLYVANYGCRNGILYEGTYSIQNDETTSDNPDDYYLVVSRADDDENRPALEGIIDGYYFSIESGTLTDNPLYKRSNYGVFVKYDVTVDANTGISTIGFWLHPKQIDNLNGVSLEEYVFDNVNPTEMEVCRVDTAGNILYTDIPGKVYLRNTLNHINDSINPHGTKLVQDTINVDYLNVASSVTIASHVLPMCVYTTAITSGIVGGSAVPAEITSAPSNPCFVTVYPTTSGAGEIYWSIESGSINLYNTGSADIELNLRIDVQ